MRRIAARGGRGRAIQIEVWPRPKDGIWDWQRCYFAPGDRVRVYADYVDPPWDYEAIIAAVKVNIYGRVNYDVAAAGECRRLALEDVIGWRRLPMDYRHHQSMRQLRAHEAGRDDTRLIFPRKRRG